MEECQKAAGATAWVMVMAAPEEVNHRVDRIQVDHIQDSKVQVLEEVLVAGPHTEVADGTTNTHAVVIQTIAEVHQTGLVVRLPVRVVHTVAEVHPTIHLQDVADQVDHHPHHHHHVADHKVEEVLRVQHRETAEVHHPMEEVHLQVVEEVPDRTAALVVAVLPDEVAVHQVAAEAVLQDEAEGHQAKAEAVPVVEKAQAAEKVQEEEKVQNNFTTKRLEKKLSFFYKK